MTKNCFLEPIFVQLFLFNFIKQKTDKKGHIEHLSATAALIESYVEPTGAAEEQNRLFNEVHCLGNS